VFVNFFGRPTSSPRGAFALARKTGAIIIPAFAARTGGPCHTIFLESPIEVSSQGDGDASELEAMQKFASILESYIRRYPTQWLWLHKRWKSTPLRKATILSDGKKGHLNQSLSVFEKIKELRREIGYSDIDTEMKTIEVSYKSGPKRILMTALTPIISRFCLLRPKLLKYCLDPKCYEEIKSTYADIVISCGSQTAAVNVLFSMENCAKSVTIMKPSLISPRNFDLVVIPEHDRPRQRENVVRTKGMPNLISPKKMESDFKALERMIELGSKRSIGVFIGGDNKNYSIDASLVEEV
jgi:Mitochondrial fission ELM1/Bacterial lipid A biosynthesis acyltransferase